MRFELINGLMLPVVAPGVSMPSAEPAPSKPATTCRLCGKASPDKPPVLGGGLEWHDPTCGHGAFFMHWECYSALHDAHPTPGEARSQAFELIRCLECGCRSFYT